MRITSRIPAITAAVCGTFIAAAVVEAQVLPPFETSTREAAIVDGAADVLNEIMQIPAKGIPRALLEDAQGLVLVPGIIKGGFVIGVERGHGIVIVRDDAGRWQWPQFVTITGGSVGWQAGIQATDLVLVFKSKRSVQGLLNGKFTIGVDAAAAAGPVGREASAGTDGKLQAEIYSYSRSRGLFAGFSVDGAKIDLDRTATDAYYRPMNAVPPGQPAPIPASALRLSQVLDRYTMKATTEAPAATPVAVTPAAPVVTPAPNTPPLTTIPATSAPAAAAPTPQEIRPQLVSASQKLMGLVADPWKKYLELPPEVYAGDALPTRASLQQALARYQAVASHPEYAALTSQPAFGETIAQLQQLLTALPQETLNLPPPPTQP